MNILLFVKLTGTGKVENCGDFNVTSMIDIHPNS